MVGESMLLKFLVILNHFNTCLKECNKKVIYIINHLKTFPKAGNNRYTGYAGTHDDDGWVYCEKTSSKIKSLNLTITFDLNIQDTKAMVW